MFSRNSSSSRAIPVAKLLEQVRTDPYVPEQWGRDQKGMRAGAQLTGEEAECCRFWWLSARDDAVASARDLVEIGVHKQHVNRLLEPFSWITVIVSATDWRNFLALRDHPEAMPEIQRLASLIRTARDASAPVPLVPGQWHLPFIREEDRQEYEGDPVWLKLLSVGRCARVSYLTHDGRRDTAVDLALAEKLCSATPPHMSPFEHQATPHDGPLRQGNFRGWRQFRHECPNESVPEAGA